MTNHLTKKSLLLGTTICLTLGLTLGLTTGGNTALAQTTATKKKPKPDRTLVYRPPSAAKAKTTPNVNAQPEAQVDTYTMVQDGLIATTPPKYVNVNMLRDAVAGKFLLKIEGGYLYQFANSWVTSADTISRPENPLWLGVGGSIAYEHASGFGLSADYFGIYSQWSAGALATDKSYTQLLHIISLAPTYRFGFGASKYVGIKLGLGVGSSISSLTVTHPDAATENLNGQYGLFLTPLVALELDNGILHLDINGKFIYSFLDIGYGGTQNYISKLGEVAAYGGFGLGLNF
ncbi:MAG: hypothetical protein QM529_01710 [Hydrotalea sp.]|nr:hypothetical protein [Hydrotalea sp.]